MQRHQPAPGLSPERTSAPATVSSPEASLASSPLVHQPHGNSAAAEGYGQGSGEVLPDAEILPWLTEGVAQAGGGSGGGSSSGQEAARFRGPPAKGDKPKLTPEQAAALAKRRQEARLYNLQAHTLSKLVEIRAYLVETGFLEAAAQDQGPRVDHWPALIADDALVDAVMAYQRAKGDPEPDGKIGRGTFDTMRKNRGSLGYTLGGGPLSATERGPDGRDRPRTIIPKGAPEAQVHAFYRDLVLSQDGVWSDKPGTVNLVGIRGATYDGKAGTVTHTGKDFSAGEGGGFDTWNDTLVAVGSLADGTIFVRTFEGTTDPGVFAAAWSPEGTQAFEVGEHIPSSGAYPALNRQQGGYGPCFRWRAGAGFEDHLGTETGGVRWANIHTTHGLAEGDPVGPGAYSEGCAVVNGETTWDERFWPIIDRAHQGGQSTFMYTVVSASRVEGLVVERQERQGGKE